MWKDKWRVHYYWLEYYDDLDHILDDSSEEFSMNNDFGSWKELFTPALSNNKNLVSYFTHVLNHLKTSHFLVKVIWFEFWKMVMHDLIYEQDSFYFPRCRSMYLKVVRIPPSKVRWMKYDVVTRGYKTILMLRFNNLWAMTNYNKFGFKISLDKKYAYQIRDEVKRGIEYGTS